jgi:hypothetical protein
VSGRRRRRPLLLLLLGVLAALGLAEATMRVAGRLAVAQAVRRRVADPVLHHRAPPRFAETQAGPDFSVVVHTNSLGFYDREPERAKPPGTFRVLVLGDSFTAGRGLTLDETPPAVVRRLLAARCARPIDVVNGGVASYSPILEYLLLRDVGLALAPDLVVLNFDLTDVRDDLLRTRLARLDAAGLPVAVPHHHVAETAMMLPPSAWARRIPGLRRLEALAAHSALYQAWRKSAAGRALAGPLRLTHPELVARGLLGDLVYDPAAITRDAPAEGEAEAWRLTRRYLRGIRDLARDHGAGFAVVTYPHPQQVAEDESPGGRAAIGAGPGLYRSERPFRTLAALGREDGYPVIDLLARFRERHAVEGRLFWVWDFHHNPRGARVLAEGTVDGLLEREMLPGCR